MQDNERCEILNPDAGCAERDALNAPGDSDLLAGPSTRKSDQVSAVFERRGICRGILDRRAEPLQIGGRLVNAL